MASRAAANAVNNPSLNQGYVGSTVTNQNSSQNTTSASNTTGNKNSTTSTQNMTPDSLAALQLLIQQLLGGGTQQQAQENAVRQQEIGANQGIRSSYSKSNAFADATGAMSQQMRKVLEQLIPSITRSAEGAGTSQNSLRALLLQDATTRAAESSAALGLKASVDYGNIQGNFSNTLEALTRPQNTVVNNLLSALGIAKGAVQNTQSNENSSSSTNSSQNIVGSSTTVTDDFKAPLQNNNTNSFDSGSWGSVPAMESGVTDAMVAASLASQGWMGRENAWQDFTF